MSVYGEDLTSPSPLAPVVVALSGLPAGSVELHEAVRKIVGAEATIETQLGVGEACVAWAEDTDEARAGVTALFTLAESRKIRATLLHGPVELRENLPLIWLPLPPALPLMKTLKATLDPLATFNPGRFVGGI